MALLRQIWSLMRKNLRRLLFRHSLMVLIMALIVPIFLSAFFSFARNLFVPPAVYGVGDVHPVMALPEAFASAQSTGRSKVVLVNNGFTGGDIETVLNNLQQQVQKAGHRIQVSRVDSEDALVTECRSSLRGVSQCYGAVVMRSSPNEGNGGIWNYTIRSDAEFYGSPVKIEVDRSTNPEEVYLLPIQKVVDTLIKQLNNPDADPLADTQEYPFTSLTSDQREARIRRIYQKAIINFMAVAFITAVLWITYHMTGFMATERESGMSQLIDAMMPVSKPWKSQAARIISHHLSFSLVYGPAWIIGSIVMREGVFPKTNAGIMLVVHLLTGLALASMSVLYASFFKKAQLSGITAILATILLGILAQSLTAPSTGPVAILSVLFAPCAYVYFITLCARFEREGMATNLVENPPDSPWEIPGIALWIFLIVQIFVYPLLGALIENALSGTTTEGRKILQGSSELEQDAVKLQGFTKVYKPSFFSRLAIWSKPSEPVVAVNDLTLNAGRGQIVALLGANGSGKSTTLDAIAGLNKLTNGTITIDGTGGLGIAPQKNVLWDDMTVEEHIRVFNRLKSPGKHASKEEILELVTAIDLLPKIKAQAKTLSGGQKRKLQLGMMLTGGSAVCCVDEVSSGIDPLSRRKIWDILLAERGRRTIILTTHFLDEADLLADEIAILSKGTLRAKGSSVALKDSLGGGYRLHAYKNPDVTQMPSVEGVRKKDAFDQVAYIAPSSRLAAQVITALEAHGITDYRFSGPTIEDVFLQLAEEIKDEEAFRGTERAMEMQNDRVDDEGESKDRAFETKELTLTNARRIGYAAQAWILFKKRFTILKRNWVPYAIVIILPIAAAGLTALFIKGQSPTGCSPADQASSSDTEDAFTQIDGDDSLLFLAGPSNKFNTANALKLLQPIFNGSGSGSAGGSTAFNNLKLVDTFSEFQSYVESHRENVTSGLWLGDNSQGPTMAWVANLYITSCLTTQQFLDILLTNTTIATTWASFDTPFSPSTGKSLNLVIYMGIALACFPGFFALYPSNERRRFVRSLEYSNGVRPFPLWIAYLCFDFIFVLLVAAIVTAIWAGVSQIWYHVEYIFIIFFLYGLASALFSYVVSLFTKSQLGTFAWAVVIQGILFLAYLIAYMSIITYAPVNLIDRDILISHWTLSALAPIGSAMRGLFLALNLFSTACDDDHLSSNPGGLLQYGGPILYLCLQSMILFTMLLYFDSGSAGSSIRSLLERKRIHSAESPEHEGIDEVAKELSRVTSSEVQGDTLQVRHLTKAFGKNLAVDNVTFGIKRDEVFALLGPNGAGKSTTISLIRGDIKPSFNGGDILVQGASVSRDLAEARANLGVCPQVDAIDLLTVEEQLMFYAKVRGISNPSHDVQLIIRAVGLEAFSTRLASALSGGNKRKLSLGIALMGNPSVVLLDEPSSGLDAASKRIMWKTLQDTVKGRGILLTTHSMEEADALASRVGILAGRMLALGTGENLRKRFGDSIFVHLVCSSAPRTPTAEMDKVIAWLKDKFPGVEVDDKTYHGQIRFSVPALDILHATSSLSTDHRTHNPDDQITHHGTDISQSAIGHLVVVLEEVKDELGIGHYSVSPTTLDQVFLTIVGRHNIQEENYGESRTRRSWWKFGR